MELNQDEDSRLAVAAKVMLSPMKVSLFTSTASSTVLSWEMNILL